VKCQRCNGNGKYKTIFGNTIICDFCYGTGEITYGENDRIEPIGNKKPMTNEEYIRTCSIEEMAECIVGVGDKKIEKLIEWLNQPHTFIDY
jgi:hypothetical protein